MKRIGLNTLFLAGALSLAGAGAAWAAADHAHGHEHGSSAATLHLDAGKKWATDDALRQAMGGIRQAMVASLHEIHENRLSTKGYAGLAHTVEEAVGSIVANCKLSAEADAQLHIVVAELLAGAEGMAGGVKGTPRRDGAVRIIGALDNYAAYFEDAGFQPIAH